MAIKPFDIAYSETGTFKDVLGTLNPRFTPDGIAETKAQWDTYVKGDPNSHKFGNFAVYLLKAQFSQPGYPPLYKWLRDCSKYGADPIDATALSEMARHMRENMIRAKPYPMYFDVKPTAADKHSVEKVEEELSDGNTWIHVTMSCPVPKLKKV
jgi:hypothetical protein